MGGTERIYHIIKLIQISDSYVTAKPNSGLASIRRKPTGRRQGPSAWRREHRTLCNLITNWSTQETDQPMLTVSTRDLCPPLPPLVCGLMYKCLFLWGVLLPGSRGVWHVLIKWNHWVWKPPSVSLAAGWRYISQFQHVYSSSQAPKDIQNVELSLLQESLGGESWSYFSLELQETGWAGNEE